MKAYLENISKQLKEADSSLKFKKINRITTLIPRVALSVGSLVSFMYLGNPYIVYVIATKRTKTGLYISSRSNLLVTCLVVNLTEVSTEITLSRIYKRRRVSNYQKISDKSYQLEDAVRQFFKERAKRNKLTIDFSLFGKENFRTFKVKEIKQLTNILLDFDTGQES